MEKHLEFRSAHYPGVFKFIKHVEEPLHNLHVLEHGVTSVHK